TLFFFSSRRRHTRSKRDWSADVCSSDLVIVDPRQEPALIWATSCASNSSIVRRIWWSDWATPLASKSLRTLRNTSWSPASSKSEIGRASCRERVEIWVGAVAEKKEYAEA